MPCSDDDDEDEEEEDAAEEDATSEPEIEDDAGFHMRVDAMHREAGSSEFVAPYFPLALAVSAEQPLEFNFDLWLMDSLKLPREIHSREEQPAFISEEERRAPPAEVAFENSREAVEYCRQKIEVGWGVKVRDPAGGQQRLTHPRIDKHQLFVNHGRSLAKFLGSGEEAFDGNLRSVKMDR